MLTTGKSLMVTGTSKVRGGPGLPFQETPSVFPIVSTPPSPVPAVVRIENSIVQLLPLARVSAQVAVPNSPNSSATKASEPEDEVIRLVPESPSPERTAPELFVKV
jgi:hypothetical protein